MSRRLRGEDDGRAAAGSRTGADQSGRKGTAGTVQQFGDAASQSRGVHAQFYLHFSEWRARQAAGQHDRQPRPRQADLARAGRKYLALRSAVWADQGSSRRRWTAAQCWFRAVARLSADKMKWLQV